MNGAQSGIVRGMGWWYPRSQNRGPGAPIRCVGTDGAEMRATRRRPAMNGAGFGIAMLQWSGKNDERATCHRPREGVLYEWRFGRICEGILSGDDIILIDGL